VKGILIMTPPMHLSRRSLLGAAGVGAGALLLGACGDDDDSGGGSGGSATIDWWHISNTEPLLSKWDKIAKDYQAANSGTTIKITPLENEAFKAKLTTVTQAGNPPDLFQSWGGGVLAQQVEAGLVKELTSEVESYVGNIVPAALEPYKIDGKLYGMPWDIGMVGFWYNKELFEKAKISAPPTTWGEFLDAVRKLKAAGVVPAGLAGKDKWPAHFYYAYLCMRVAGLDALKQAAKDKSFENPDFVAAATRFKEFIDLKPFQSNFLSAEYGTPDGQAAAVGNGKAAFELMGQWAPSTQKEWSSNKKGLGDKLGFFTFPAVDGGKGQPTDAFGGGNGFAIGKDAPEKTFDYMKNLMTVENQRVLAATGAITPTVKGAEDALTDPNLKAVAAAVASATGFQLYLDQAWPPAVGTQVNDSVAALVAGKATPEQVSQQITSVFKSQ
jgi:raffinose/stachyose/melibiose transport system substrate-binding protein